MPRFKGGASGLAPLALQLSPSPYGTDPATSTIEVVGFYAAVETEPGVAMVVSRPVLTRPSTLGTPAGTTRPLEILGVGNPAAISQSELLAAYGTPPSFPSVSPYTTFGPFEVQWAAGTGEGQLILPGTAILLYALAGTNAAWNAQFEWNE